MVQPRPLSYPKTLKNRTSNVILKLDASFFGLCAMTCMSWGTSESLIGIQCIQKSLHTALNFFPVYPPSFCSTVFVFNFNFTITRWQRVTDSFAVDKVTGKAKLVSKYVHI